MLDIIVVSDSTGETANSVSNSIMVQFPDIKFEKTIYPYVNNLEEVNRIFEIMKENSLLIMSVVMPEIAQAMRIKAQEKNIYLVDILGPISSAIEEMTGLKSINQAGLGRGTNNDYFNKMEAIEFALKYDDGKNPRGFLLSDIVLVGVSRTSKTPLSIFLANKNYKVSNLPLLPELDLPKEIFEVDKNKIIGLIIDEQKLKEIRGSRLRVLGLEEGSIYAKDDRIKKELDYAKKVFEDLSCPVIDVTGRSIESVGAEIIRYVES
ncbi:MAG: pyruvate, water dikinase regulatory protein [Tissierellia bacterium]|nr:pyruvate, water dikinase regulatory protein [Tissierellia bacterium]